MYEEFVDTCNKFYSTNLDKLNEYKGQKAFITSFKQEYNYLQKSNYCSISKIIFSARQIGELIKLQNLANPYDQVCNLLSN
jgi:hypothetical protein